MFVSGVVAMCLSLIDFADLGLIDPLIRAVLFGRADKNRSEKLPPGEANPS